MKVLENCILFLSDLTDLSDLLVVKNFGKIRVLLSEVIFFYVFFLAFLVFVYVFSVII